ncbi:hypothetical protein HMPREF0971_02158 [Segatella oris F0302]|uniref:Uncharacterized protein n=1 Tax=Segatella oris F0302 TaxID=649760 RepID=D1QT31_9BACT|nr:hypothetical protein HMPREF0971_02158 [Segatella oris F0302]
MLKSNVNSMAISSLFRQRFGCGCSALLQNGETAMLIYIKKLSATCYVCHFMYLCTSNLWNIVF